ncbi:hypothetical protein GOBAR_AA24412 [Gossypium barbadense]|uniref:Uncharacterized protein n=1 Tax=Gossypium barbadense TaxID=3634 RepID=A0A2P5WYZ9_GOSBA|nr:hypothetical protein GOBAR_AA24412 [Gossypium barbadense]
MSSSRGKKAAIPTFKKRKGASSSAGPTAKIRHPSYIKQVQLADTIRVLLTTDPWELLFGIIEPTYLKLTMELCSTFHLQTVMTSYDDPGTVQFHLGRLVHQSVSQNLCWHTLAPDPASYNPSHSKASVLPPSLRYLHAILPHMITGGRESTGVITGIHRTEWYRKEVISIGLYVTQLARHFGLLNRGPRIIPYPHRQDHEDPLTQPLPPSRPVHVADSYADISERLTRFEQQCFQRFDNIDATLQQIFQHFHISSPVPPREPSSDEDELKLHRERFSTTAISCSPTTIATSRDNILLAQDLWPNEPLRPLEYPLPLSNRLLSRTPVRGIHNTGSFTSLPI